MFMSDNVFVWIVVLCIQGYRPAGEDRVPYQHALLGAHPGGGQATHRLRWLLLYPGSNNFFRDFHSSLFSLFQTLFIQHQCLNFTQKNLKT